MKAIVVHQYGGPEVLKFEDYPDAMPGVGEVMMRVPATSVNPSVRRLSTSFSPSAILMVSAFSTSGSR